MESICTNAKIVFERSCTQEVPCIYPDCMYTVTTLWCLQLLTYLYTASATPLDLLINNASYLAGWQIAAVASNLFPNPCHENQSFYANWARIGLNTEILETVLCGRQGCNIDNDYANQFAHFFRYISAIFTQQIIYVFENIENEFEFLCYKLDPRALVNLTGTTDTRSAVCNAIGVGNPRWTPLGNGQPPTSEFNYEVANASALLAWEILGGVTDASEIQNLCENFGSFTTLLLPAGLQPHAIEPVLCNQVAESTLAPSWEVQSAITTLSSIIFAIQVYNVNQNDYWKQFICEGYKEDNFINLSQDVMAAMGLDSVMVFPEIAARCMADNVGTYYVG